MLAETRSQGAGLLGSPLRGVGKLSVMPGCAGSWPMPSASPTLSSSQQHHNGLLTPVTKPARHVEPEASSPSGTDTSTTASPALKRPPSPCHEAADGTSTLIKASSSGSGALVAGPPTPGPTPSDWLPVSASKSSAASHGSSSSGRGSPAAAMHSSAAKPAPADAQLMMPTGNGISTTLLHDGSVQLWNGPGGGSDSSMPVASKGGGSSSSVAPPASPYVTGSISAFAPSPALHMRMSQGHMTSSPAPAAASIQQPAAPAAGASAAMDEATLMQLLGVSAIASPHTLTSPAPQASPHMESLPGLVMLRHSPAALATNGPLSADTMAALLALQQQEQQQQLQGNAASTNGSVANGSGIEQMRFATDLLRSPLTAAQEQLLAGSTNNSAANSTLNLQPQLMYDSVTGQLVGGEALVAHALLASSPNGSMGNGGSYGSMPCSVDALCASMLEANGGSFQQCLAAAGSPAGAGFGAGSPGPGNRQNSLYKTELCRSWNETGACRYGNKCQFAHGHDELRTVIRHPKYKTEICRTFAQTGTCPYGARCRFIHASRSAANSMAASPAGAIMALGSPAGMQMAYAGMVKSLSESGLMTPQGYMTPEKQTMPSPMSTASIMHSPSPGRYGIPIGHAAAIRAGMSPQTIAAANSNANDTIFGGQAAGVPLGSATPQQQASARRLPVFAQLTSSGSSSGRGSAGQLDSMGSGDDACWAMWQGSDLAAANGCSAGDARTPPPVYHASRAGQAGNAAEPQFASLNEWLASPQQQLAQAGAQRMAAGQAGAAATCFQAQEAANEAANEAVNAILSVLNM